MTTNFGVLTIGASAVQITSTPTMVCQIKFQVAPSATGVCKVGNSGSMTADNTTGGSFLAPGTGSNPGAIWTLQNFAGVNQIDLSQLWVHGTHATDKVMYEYETY